LAERFLRHHLFYELEVKQMATPAQFRIDHSIHDLLMSSNRSHALPPSAQGLTLPAPVFPQYPELLKESGPDTPPEKRQWSRSAGNHKQVPGRCTQFR
jgi:hypothetical protein